MYLFSENGQNVANVKTICKSTPLYVKKSKKRVAPSLHGTTSHWLHENSIPNIGCHYFWPGLIALPRNTPPIICQIMGYLLGLGTIPLDPTFGSFTLLEPISH
jgi:hypothetical protein